jgi:MFS family permease
MSFTSLSGRERTPLWRDVYLVAGARGVSYCGDFLAATTLALTLQSRGDNGFGVAALLIASTLPIALLAPLAGRLADRVDSRRLLVTTGVAQAIVCAALAFTSSTVAMVALVALVSAGLALSQSTMSALVPDMVFPNGSASGPDHTRQQHLSRAMSIVQTASAVGMLLGPAAGGLLVGTYGTRLPLLIDAVTYLALAGVGLVLRTRRGGRAATRPRTEGPAWRIRDDRLLVMLMTAVGTVIAAVTAVNVVEIFFVRETLGSTEAMYGLVQATWTLGVLVGAWPFGRAVGADHRLVTSQLFLLGGMSLIILGSAAVTGVWWLLPLYVCGGVLNAGINVLSGVVVSRRAPAVARGRVFGTFAAVANVANLAGYVLGGLLLQVASPRVIIAGTGVAGLLVAAVVGVFMVVTASPGKVAAPVAEPVGYRGET